MASVLSEAYFQDEAAAFERLEAIVWKNGPVCPHCGETGRIYELKGVRSKPSKKNPEGIVRHGLRKCGACRKQFTVRKGTVFEDSPIPLHIWFQAAYLMCSSKKGVSSNQLHRTLGVTLQTAWFMSHRLREAMRDGTLAPLGGAGGVIEADTTFVGGKEKNKHVGKRNARWTLLWHALENTWPRIEANRGRRFVMTVCIRRSFPASIPEPGLRRRFRLS